jgi:cobalt/nickel transport system permease protein
VYHGHSPVHRLGAHTKIVALVVYVLAVVSTPPLVFWAYSGYALILMVVLSLSEVPPRFFLTRMAIDLPFVLFAFLLPWVGSEPRLEVGPLTLSEPGLVAAWNILVKATLGAGASIVLVATTEIPDIFKGLQRLKVPAVLVAIASFMIRYMDIIAGEFRRTRTAMEARGHNPKSLLDAKPLAIASGALFIRSYERGERVHHAMLARGYNGSWPVLTPSPISSRVWMGALAPSLFAVVIAVVARLL